MAVAEKRGYKVGGSTKDTWLYGVVATIACLSTVPAFLLSDNLALASDSQVINNSGINTSTLASQLSSADNTIVYSVVANYTKSENRDTNAVDGNTSTHWGNGGNSSIKIGWGSQKPVESVNISWFKGNERNYYFKIALSNDTKPSITVFKGNSNTVAEDYRFKNIRWKSPHICCEIHGRISKW